MLYYRNNYKKVRGQSDSSSWILILGCNECRKCMEKLDFSNETFFKCISTIVELEGKEKIDSIQIDEKIFVPKDVFSDLFKFFSFREVIHEIDVKIESSKQKACQKGLKSCMLGLMEQVGSKHASDLDWLYVAYPEKYMEMITRVSTHLEGNMDCARCMNVTGKEIKKLIHALMNVYLIKKGVMEKELSHVEYARRPFDLLNRSLQSLAFTNSQEKSCTIAHGKEIERYFVGGSTIIEISIFEIEDMNEKMYDLAIHLPFTDDFMRLLRRDVEKDLEDDHVLLKMERFNDILEHVLDITRSKITQSVRFEKEKDREIVALMTSFSILGLEKLFPLLMDEQIEEIFLDSPEQSIYLHHARHQHCRTTISLGPVEIQRVISRLRLETDKNLNELYPSLKCVIKNNFFYTRFNVDVKPLNPLGFSLDIRRLNKKAFDIIDLVQLETMNLEIAAFLVFCLHARMNLTIIGKTDTGKTTLLNALDMLYPPHLRKIYVEDEIETIAQDPGHHHQLKFKTTSKERKSELIRNLLHRSPEVLILGEILTKEETDAMFHCLSTGMRGLQTVHASSTASFFTRLRIHFKISDICFTDLDFIVLLEKAENGKRTIMEVAEFDRGNGDQVFTRVLARRDQALEKWRGFDIENSRVMREYFHRTRFNQDIFNEYMDALKMVIANSCRGRIHETNELVKSVNQVYIRFRDYF